MPHLVTRDSIQQLLNKSDQHRIHTIGHALRAIFLRQTEQERSANLTTVHNTIGFSGPDARTGSLAAKYYMKHKTLQPWMINIWSKEVCGFPRICKYWRQLDQIAKARAAIATMPNLKEG